MYQGATVQSPSPPRPSASFRHQQAVLLDLFRAKPISTSPENGAEMQLNRSRQETRGFVSPSIDQAGTTGSRTQSSSRESDIVATESSLVTDQTTQRSFQSAENTSGPLGDPVSSLTSASFAPTSTTYVSQHPMAPSDGNINIPRFDPLKYGKPSSHKPIQRSNDISASAEQSKQGRTQQGSSQTSKSAGTLNFPSNPYVTSYSSGPAKQISRPGQSLASTGPSVLNRSYPISVRNDADHDPLSSMAMNSQRANIADQITANTPKAALFESQRVEDKCESPEEMLKRVQDVELQRIGYRNRSKGNMGTTSLKDLEIARRHLPPRSVASNRLEPRTTSDIPSSDLPPQVQLLTSPRDQGAQPFEPELRVERKRKAQTQEINNGMTLPNWGAVPQQPKNEPRPRTQNTDLSSEPQKRRNPRWATNAELKPIQVHVETDSNAWGSDVPSDAATESNDSVKPMHHGKLLRHRSDQRPEHSLTGWDGKLQPPPVDWNDRPRFNNNTPEFKNGFNNWAKATAQLVLPTGADHDFHVITPERLGNLDLQADGVDLVHRDFTLDYTSARKYGYEEDNDFELAQVTANCEPIDPYDWENWGLLDRTVPENAQIEHETTEDLVRGWNAHQGRRHSNLMAQDTEVAPQLTSRQKLENYRPAPNPNRPKLNIYLRPAVKSDLPQLTDLYNWHVENSTCTAEFMPASVSDMRYRFDNSFAQRLPFIVAVLRKDSKSVQQGGRDTVIGFASAQDFTASDFVERISAEVEVYVHHGYLHKGVGRCLLDQIVFATDRGHLKRGGYPFHCAPEESHKFETGGLRDLHALVVVIRFWRYPRRASHLNGKGKKLANGRNNGPLRDDNPVDTSDDMKINEDDYKKWVKPWLERWDFEEQGVLKGVATKKGRFLNVAYLVKETKWQPAEGKIPEYHPPVGVGVEDSEDD